MSILGTPLFIGTKVPQRPQCAPAPASAWVDSSIGWMHFNGKTCAVFCYKEMGGGWLYAFSSKLFDFAG